MVQVLVRVGPHSRVVHFESDGDLVPAIRRAFSDLRRVVDASSLVIQLKDEEWGGEFVDLKEGQMPSDHSVVNVIPQVGTVSFASY